LEKRKNILFVTNRVPFPPDKGDKTRTFHQLDHLALTHAVYCACFVDPPQDARYVETLRRWCVDVAAVPWNKKKGILRAIKAWPSDAPLTTSAYDDAEMSARLKQWSGRIPFDAAVAFSSSVAPYALAFPAKRHVLDLCDVDSQKWLDYACDGGLGAAMIYRREGRRLRTYELECLKRFDATIVITDRERQILDPRGACPTLHVIPNGVALCGERPDAPSTVGPVIGFIGVMDYRPNVQGVCWFVQEVWPRVRREIPEARFVIVGRRPTRRVLRLAKVAGVEVTGEVDDARSYLANLRVVVAPLQIARGLQNKVLEAMAMRRPVVTTTAVASGLHVRPGHNILAADDPESFAEKIIELWRFDGLCDKIGDAGYRCAATYYGWAETLQRYERVVLGRPAQKEDNLIKTVRGSTGCERSRYAAAHRMGSQAAGPAGRCRRSSFAVLFRGAHASGPITQ
jgi:sugar transferase (PEP-CTERM/EpsH1 system associated)